MDDKFLVQCAGLETTAILKMAMINASIQVERCCSRKERQEIRQFILGCAEILSKSSTHSLNQDSVPENNRQEN